MTVPAAAPERRPMVTNVCNDGDEAGRASGSYCERGLIGRFV
jgi:hypothetical protein